MTLKKWRPFWSYDVEKTEQWLSEMAAEGKRLTRINRLTRMFSFDNGTCKEAEYQIVYDKSKSELPRVLEESGWENASTEGNWQFIKNEKDTIRAYPARDNLLKRNRLHSIVLMCISVYYGVQLIMPLLLIFSVLFLGPGEVNIVPSPYWSLTILYFLQVIGVIILSIQMTRKLRAFERKYFNTEVDAEIPVGETISKWSPFWMSAPDLLEKWLAKMSAEGNHLVGMRGTRFTFEKGAPKLVSYICDYQWRPSPGYTDLHKSAGWQLKYTSSHSFMKYSLWAKTYEEGDQKPKLTYDTGEKKAQTRKVLLAHCSSNIIGFAFITYALWISFSNLKEFGWSPFQYFLVGALIVAIFIQIHQSIRTIRYALRMGKF